MSIKKILTIVLTLVMGIALTGVLATNINSVESNGYIEINGEQYDYIEVYIDDVLFDLYDVNDNEIDVGLNSVFIETKNVFITSSVTGNNWVNGVNNETTLFNKEHNSLSINIEYTEVLEITGNSNDNMVDLYTENVSDGDNIIISANINGIKPNILTILSLVPLIFSGAVVYFVYNSRFD